MNTFTLNTGSRGAIQVQTNTTVSGIPTINPSLGGGDPSTSWPVGSIFISTVSTNPFTLLGFGTWVSVGSGRVLVGFDSGQAEFNTLGGTGGEKTHTLTENEIPSHTHTQDAHGHTVNDPGHTHSYNESTSAGSDTRSGGNFGSVGATTGSSATGITINNTVATNQNTGGGQAHNNLQPYLVVHMWERTA